MRALSFPEKNALAVFFRVCKEGTVKTRNWKDLAGSILPETVTKVADKFKHNLALCAE